jgi:hypothetical protein
MTYFNNFSGYPVGTSLFLNPPNYVPVSGASSAWQVAAGLGGQVAWSGPAGSWTNTYYAVSHSGYLDWSVRVNALAGYTGLFFNATSLDVIPANGYYLQFQFPHAIELIKNYGSGSPVLIGVAYNPPANWADVHLELIDNAGTIDLYIDGLLSIHVIDTTRSSGYWGFTSYGTSGYYTDIKVNDGTCLPTNTDTPTPVNTPTPPYVPTPCLTFQAFTPMLTPVLVPTMAYEQNCVVEPSVIRVGGIYHMSYTCNAFQAGGLPSVIGLATSLDGIAWTRYGSGPILGSGVGGEAFACRSSQLKIGYTYWIYYKDVYNNICRASSSDAFTYTKDPQIVLPFNCLNPYGIQGFDSTGFWHVPGTYTYYALVDAFYGSGSPQFRTWLIKSVDNGATFQPICNLTSILPNAVDDGSPRAFVKIGNVFHLWSIISVPSNVWHFISPDMYNWTSDAQLTLSYCPTGCICGGGISNLFGLAACNQAADTCYVDRGNELWLYYDGTDNVNSAGRIGYAVYHGSAAMFNGCGSAAGGSAAGGSIYLRDSLKLRLK